jgi:hypothetical protein
MAVFAVVLLFLLQTASAGQVRYWSGASGYRGFPLQVASGVGYVYTTPSATVSGNTVVASSLDVAAYANNTVGNAVATSRVIADQFGQTVNLSGQYYFSIHLRHNLWAGVMQANVSCGSSSANASAAAFYILGLTVNDTTNGGSLTVLNAQEVIGPPLTDPVNGTPLPAVPWYIPNVGNGFVATCWSQGVYGWGTTGLSAQTLGGLGNLTLGPSSQVSAGHILTITVRLIAEVSVWVVNAGPVWGTSASASIQIFNSGSQPSYTTLLDVTVW